MKEISKSDQPRERMARLGVQALSTSEIIALLIGDASADAALTRRLLVKFRSLHTLARSSLREFASLKGFSAEKAGRLVAAFELGRRLTKELIVKVPVNSPDIVCQLLAQDLRTLSRESLRVILLDTKYQLLTIEEVSLGSLNETVAHPREIFRPALIHSAYAMILVHNHPSGDPTPSASDKLLTRRMAKAGKLLGVELADHIIIGSILAEKKSYFSFKEEKLL